jgi:hypothetical protein
VQALFAMARLVGGRGHYLNSRIELGSGVLDLIRAHGARLEPAAARVEAARRRLLAGLPVPVASARSRFPVESD